MRRSAGNPETPSDSRAAGPKSCGKERGMQMARSLLHVRWDEAGPRVTI